MQKTKHAICRHCSQSFSSNCLAAVYCSLKCRLLAKVRKSETGCWEWIGGKDQDGYGLLSINDKSQRASRISFEVFNCQKVPNGKCICHTCDNPSCINPGHLFVGSALENAHDMIQKKRARYAEGKKILNEEIIKRIFFLKKKGLTNNEISYCFQISLQHLSSILDRKIWTHVEID